MKTKLIVLALLAVGAVSAQIPIVVTIGAPPAPRIVRVQPASPGTGYSWIDGYWYPVANRYNWHQGYWTRPPYEGTQWIAPRYDSGQYYQGYWKGGDRKIQHDHRWDRGGKHQRDYDRDDKKVKVKKDHRR